MDSVWFKKRSFNNSIEKISNNYDVIIIGAGIAGLSCGYWLREKSLKVLIIDKDDFGQGASGRNAGFLTGGSIGYFTYLRKILGDKSAIEKWKYTTNNIRLIKNEFPEIVLKNNFLGTISLYQRSENISEILDAVKLLQNHAINVEITNNYFDMFGINMKSDGTINPFAFLELLIKSINNSVDFLFNTTVSHLSANSILVGKREIFGSKIILATNYGINEFFNNIPIEPKRSQIAYFECNNSNLVNSNFLIPNRRVYFRKHERGVILGGLRYLDDKNENTSKIELNRKIQDGLKTQCKELFGECRLIHAWAGIMGFTSDEQPLLGVKDNIYYLGGFSGHGNGYAFSMARDLINQFIIK